MHARILWAIVGGFLAGVFIESVASLSWSFAWFAMLLAASALSYAFIDRKKISVLIVCAVACVAFGAGMLRAEMAAQTGDPRLAGYLDKKVVLEGYVADEPDVREGGTRLSLRIDALVVGSTTVAVTAGVLALAPPHTDAAYGDTVRAGGTLRLPEVFDTGEGRVFNYPLYLAKDGILYQLAFAQVERTGEYSGNPVKAAAISLKHAYLGGLGQVLVEPEAGLAGGITVGDKRSIGSELSRSFQRASLIHMVVLSGYNITIVINAAASLLAWAGRTAQFSGSAFVVLFFVLMAGGAASAVRAGAMALIAMYARVSGRQFIALRVLGAVCFVMVLWNPLTLLYDPSFQLSVLATLGLVLFTPHFARYLAWVPERFGLREILSSTLGTQLTVLPLLLYQNGSLSLVALPANLLALLPMPIAMLASFVAALSGMLLGPYGVPFAYPAYLILAYIVEVAELFAALPFASVALPSFSAWWMAAAYALLLSWYWYLKKKTPGYETRALTAMRRGTASDQEVR